MTSGGPTDVAPLSPPMHTALELAWESFAAGSSGIGAVATTGDHVIISSGRNRILEQDAGTDVLAGTSVAHAEMNVLAKLPYRAHEDTASSRSRPSSRVCSASVRSASAPYVVSTSSRRIRCSEVSSGWSN